MRLLDIITENNHPKIKNAMKVYSALRVGKSSYQVRDNNMDILTYDFEYELSDVTFQSIQQNGRVILMPMRATIKGGKIPGQQTHIFDKLAQRFNKFNILISIYPISIEYTSEEDREPDHIKHQDR